LTRVNSGQPEKDWMKGEPQNGGRQVWVTQQDRACIKGKRTKNTSVRRGDNQSENMRMSEFVTMRYEVQVVAVRSTRLKTDGH